ncbi:hypothetical protein GCM10010234_54460 [Streptomyces hawaiiensis]
MVRGAVADVLDGGGRLLRGNVDTTQHGAPGDREPAPRYGPGLSERRLGAARRGRARDAYVVVSKVGRLLVPNEHPRRTDGEGLLIVSE